MLTAVPLRTDSTPEENIKAKLKGLGINGIHIKSPIVGPILTGYPIVLGNSVPISKIMKTSEDLALAMGVESVDIRRIGKEVIVFVPNEDREVVDFKDALHWYLKNEKVKEMILPILIGMDFQGANFALDLSLQPHILIAGSTGAGKSTFETSIICALSTLKSAQELEIYLVDTKGLDLTLFENLPHVKELARSADDYYLLINSLDVEVQKRNRIFQRHGFRNITEYNQKSETKLPHIVLIIDELADLIDKDKAERLDVKSRTGQKSLELSVPDSLKKLIQICRASGVHIIACTQRTSVDVISGTIKANFPTRISLKLPTGVDSRVILDQNGAENLLGRGDMLIKRTDSDMLERFHSPFVRLEDIEAILSQQDIIRNSNMIN